MVRTGADEHTPQYSVSAALGTSALPRPGILHVQAKTRSTGGLFAFGGCLSIFITLSLPTAGRGSLELQARIGSLE